MISIIVAAYNCGRYIEQAIRSAQAQTYRDFELVIVDDGSQDDTLAVARRLAEADPRIRVFTQPNSGGPAAPRNRGIALSRGEYVCFLDPDDFWYPHKLARQVALIESRPDVALVFSDMHRVDPQGANLGPTYLGRVNYLATATAHLERLGPDTWLTGDGFYAYSSVGVVGPVTSAVVVRRSALDALDELFPLDLAVGEDIDLWFRILERGRAAFIEEPLHAYRQHPASLMHDLPRVTRGLIATHERNYARVRRLLSPAQHAAYRRRIATHVFDLGVSRWNDADLRAARAAYLRALGWYPAPKFALALAKTLLPAALVERRLKRRAAGGG